MRLFVSICVSAGALLVGQFAQATTLTFDPATSAGGPVTPGYGSNTGDTPDVSVAYTNVDWYADQNVPGVTFPGNGESSNATHDWTYTFTAAPTFKVTLLSFTAADNDSNPPVVDYSVSGALGTVGGTFTPASPGFSNPSLISVTGATGSTLVLTFHDESTPTNGGIGIDNIVISESSVPEPASACVLALLGTRLLVRRRRL